MESFDHDEVFADVAAFEFAGEEVGHESADEVAAVADGFSDEVEFDFEPAGDGDLVFVHDLADVVAVVPFVVFDLFDGFFFGRVFE